MCAKCTSFNNKSVVTSSLDLRTNVSSVKESKRKFSCLCSSRPSLSMHSSASVSRLSHRTGSQILLKVSTSNQGTELSVLSLCLCHVWIMQALHLICNTGWTKSMFDQVNFQNICFTSIIENINFSPLLLLLMFFPPVLGLNPLQEWFVGAKISNCFCHFLNVCDVDVISQSEIRSIAATCLLLQVEEFYSSGNSVTLYH